MDKKTKRRIEVLRTRLQKLKQPLAGAKKQCDDPEELANLQKETLTPNPHEDRDLAAEHPEVVARLAATLHEWWPAGERQVLTNWSE